IVVVVETPPVDVLTSSTLSNPIRVYYGNTTTPKTQRTSSDNIYAHTPTSIYSVPPTDAVTTPIGQPTDPNDPANTSIDHNTTPTDSNYPPIDPITTPTDPTYTPTDLNNSSENLTTTTTTTTAPSDPAVPFGAMNPSGPASPVNPTDTLTTPNSPTNIPTTITTSTTSTPPAIPANPVEPTTSISTIPTLTTSTDPADPTSPAEPAPIDPALTDPADPASPVAPTNPVDPTDPNFSSNVLSQPNGEPSNRNGVTDDTPHGASLAVTFKTRKQTATPTHAISLVATFKTRKSGAGSTLMSLAHYEGSGSINNNWNSKLKFLNEVIVNKPNLDMSTWDIICQHMNSFMYTNTYWSTPYYFFDGKSCYRVFQNMVLRKYLGTSTATEESDSDDSPENFNGSFYNYEDRNVLKYMRKAKVVYDESVEQYLKTRYPDYDI
ncbi:hypothetical protein C6P44_001970, partial [Monosporozyma unispora]